MASDDIRKILDLLESANTPESIEEDSLSLEEDFLSEGWLTNFSNKMKRKMGQRELDKLSKRLNSEWHTWLGQVSRTGDLDDMKRFMKVRVGFNDEDIEQVLNDPNSPVKPETSADKPEDEKAANQSIKTGHELNGGDHKDQENSEEPASSEPTTPEVPSEPEQSKKDDGGFSDAIRAAQAKARERRTGASASTTPQSEPADSKREPGEVIDDPANYMGVTGKLDPKKINDKLRSMPVGDKLTLGKRTFFLSPKEDKTKKETIGEADAPASQDGETAEDQPLSNGDVEQLLHLAASHINDEYLLHGPKNDEYYDKRDRTNYAAQPSASGNPGGPKPSGQYDPNELWDVLSSNGFSKNRFKNLEQKVAGSKSVADMSNEEMRQMALIGYALLRSRT